MLDGVPLALACFESGAGISGSRRRVGFDWPEIEGVLDKIAEEIEEIKRATNEEELASEIGDLFFALVNLARWKKVDAEVRAARDEYEIQEAFCVCGAGRKETGTRFIRFVAG